MRHLPILLLATLIPIAAAPGVARAADLPGPRPATSVVGDPAERQIKFQLELSLWALASPGRRSGVYGAYGQRSRWNLEDSPESFRVENDFRPEVGVAFGPDLGGRLLDVWPGWLTLSTAYVHESNGLEGPHSRSWNRWLGTVHLAPEGARFNASITGWKEFRVEDTTRGITDHAGVGELRLSCDLPGWLEGSSVRISSAFSPNAPDDTFFTNLDAALHLWPRFLPRWLAPGDDGPAIDLVVEAFVGSGEFLYEFTESAPRIRLGLALRP